MMDHTRWWAALLALTLGMSTWRSPVCLRADDSGGAVSEASSLEGKWEVCSASYQLEGHVFYTFRDDILTIDSEIRDGQVKRADAPRRTSQTRWKVRFDKKKSPHRMILTKISATGKRDIVRTDAFELRDGELWMRTDDGEPFTSDHLRPGAGGLVTGLRRIKSNR